MQFGVLEAPGPCHGEAIVKTPSVSRGDFVKRKSFQSINVQVTVEYWVLSQGLGN